MIWVGFELLFHSYQLGISARRAKWLTKWAREVATSTYIQMNKFEAGLGRIVYVAGDLEFERPFLGPLYKFLTGHPRGSVRRVEVYGPPLPLRVRDDLIRSCTQSRRASER